MKQAIEVIKPPPTGEGRRLALWILWTLNMLLNVVYVALSFATSSRMVTSVKEVRSAFDNSAWRAPIAACVLGGLMVMLFNIMSCAVLIKKSINQSGPGFGYGFIMAWCFVMCFFCFLCGLVLDSFEDTVQAELQDVTKWKSYWTTAYKATVACAFLCCALYLIFFLALVIFQGGISKAIGLYDVKTDQKRRMEMATAMKAGAMMGSNQQI